MPPPWLQVFAHTGTHTAARDDARACGNGTRGSRAGNGPCTEPAILVPGALSERGCLQGLVRAERDVFVPVLEDAVHARDVLYARASDIHRNQHAQSRGAGTPCQAVRLDQPEGEDSIA